MLDYETFKLKGNTRFFLYKQQVHKQRQAEIAKKSSIW